MTGALSTLVINPHRDAGRSRGGAGVSETGEFRVAPLVPHDTPTATIPLTVALAEYRRQYQAANRERLAEYQRQYRARKKAAGEERAA